eukprot:GHVS01056217.1.p1 GENE.GHVS01056217.1~~GHVS01056217.1.p1  ORF type:complete len:625 (+),score=76.77 GHVS01056217.1:289-2163(+)
MYYFALFLHLLSFVLQVFADEPDHMRVVMAVPRGHSMNVETSRDGITFSMETDSILRVEFPYRSYDNTLANNFHAVFALLREMYVDKRVWETNTTDEYFAWAEGPVEQPTKVMRLTVSDHEPFEFDLVEGRFHSIRYTSGSPNWKRLPFTYPILRKYLEEIMRQPGSRHAELLYSWIGQDRYAVGGDPWKNLPLFEQHAVLDDETKFRKDHMDKECDNREIWETRDIEEALEFLRLRHQKQSHLNEVEVARKYVLWAAAVAGNEIDSVVAKLESDVTHQYYGKMVDSELSQMVEMQRMWDELYEQEGQTPVVYNTRLFLITEGQAAFNRLKDAGIEKWNKAYTTSIMNESVANGFKQRNRALLAYQQLNSRPAEMQRNEADVLALKEMLKSMNTVLANNKQEQVDAADVKLKFTTVFGGAEDLDMSTADPELAGMVRDIMRIGNEYGTAAGSVLADRRKEGESFAAAVQDYTSAIEALNGGRRNDMPQSVREALNEGRGLYVTASCQTAYKAESFRHPQMVLSFKPISKLFDIWYRLLIEALKELFAAHDDWVESWGAHNWTLTKLSVAADKSNPYFIANKELQDVLVPQFVEEHYRHRAPSARARGEHAQGCLRNADAGSGGS